METQKQVANESPFGSANPQSASLARQSAAALKQANKENPVLPAQKGANGKKGGHKRQRSSHQAVAFDENSASAALAPGKKELKDASVAQGPPVPHKTERSLFGDSTQAVTNVT